MKSAICGACIACAVVVGWSPSVNAADIKLYGKLYPYVVNERGSGATSAGTPVSTLAGTPTGQSAISEQSGLASGNSRLGLRGSQDIPGDLGLKAIFQIEGTIQVDSSSNSNIADRNTFVGLQGGFGTVKFGTMDTVFKEYGDTIGFFGVGSGTFMSTSGVLRKTGFGTNSASSFHLRRDNTVMYETPEWNGFTASAEWSSGESKSNGRDPALYSFGAKYESGPISLLLAHEIHEDFFGGSRNVPSARSNYDDPSVSSTDAATELTVQWDYVKGHSVELGGIRKEYKESNVVTAGRFRNYRNMAYKLAVEDRWGEHWRTTFSYVYSDNGSCSVVAQSCSTEGLKGQKFTAGVAYYLSKDLWVFGAYNLVNNGKSARYSSIEFDDNPVPGEDITQAAVGLAFQF